MAHHDKIASRYAKAIYEFLKTPEKICVVVKELLSFVEVLKSSKDLTHVLTTEVFSKKQCRGVVEDVMGVLKFSEDTKKVLLVLSESGRLDRTEAIAENLNSLLLEAGNTVSLSVMSSSVLTEIEQGLVEKRFKSILGKEVEANYLVIPDLLGGLRVTAGGRTFDGSLAGWLTDLKEQLVGGSF